MTIYREMDMPFWLKKFGGEDQRAGLRRFQSLVFSCGPNGIPPVPDSISEVSGRWHDS